MISVMETMVKVKVSSLISNPIQVKLALRQGNALSVITHLISRDIRKSNTGNEYQATRLNIIYATM